jgi:hypothetical protein
VETIVSDQSDEQKGTQPEPVLPSLPPNRDSKLFLEFLKERIGEFKCVLCGHRAFAIYGQADNSLSDIRWPVYVADLSTGQYYGVSPFSCSNCGNIYSINPKVFEDWLKTRNHSAE